MSLEQKLTSALQHLREDLDYAAATIAYISPLALGAYKGVMDTADIPVSSQLIPAIGINAFGTASLLALNSQTKKAKYATYGALSAIVTAPFIYSIGYSIGYCTGKILYG